MNYITTSYNTKLLQRVKSSLTLKTLQGHYNAYQGGKHYFFVMFEPPHARCYARAERPPENSWRNRTASAHTHTRTARAKMFIIKTTTSIVIKTRTRTHTSSSSRNCSASILVFCEPFALLRAQHTHTPQHRAKLYDFFRLSPVLLATARTKFTRISTWIDPRNTWLLCLDN